LSGSVSIGSTNTLKGDAVLIWTLVAAYCNQMVVRAVDLGFGFVGTSTTGDKHYLFEGKKNWCPLGFNATQHGLPFPETTYYSNGCIPWHGSLRTMEAGVVAPHRSTHGATNAAGAHATRAPPRRAPTPKVTADMWAFSNLTRPGRSAFTGGHSSSAGYAGWSTQIVLPFQSFGLHSSSSPDGVGALVVSSGSARINTHLRCGSVLPVTLKWGFYEDITGDDAVDVNDAVVWTRDQYPKADWLVRAGLITKLQNDVTSYTNGGCNGSVHDPQRQSRATFNKTLDAVKWLSRWSDNSTHVMHLVGWQGTGHDTLYPSLDRLNPYAGTKADLERLSAEAKRYNTLISYHINTDEACECSCATKCAAGSTHLSLTPRYHLQTRTSLPRRTAIFPCTLCPERSTASPIRTSSRASWHTSRTARYGCGSPAPNTLIRCKGLRIT
jgi:hypothetical protein